MFEAEHVSFLMVVGTLPRIMSIRSNPDKPARLRAEHEWNSLKNWCLVPVASKLHN